ncbi:hypothetical protein DV515_00006115 [Chloebia gouldiae]|uniref:Uncharacterized protein n=1 Tax=Chloebia gouldiae TaxID=44316 RepID=A0A3L8SL60_CHLGU|nr:hypothetical protein DV515_00006115 [Chloebia gouldiae]
MLACGKLVAQTMTEQGSQESWKAQLSMDFEEMEELLIAFLYYNSVAGVTLQHSESEEVYQRQVLSIACIVFGIVVVGMLCAAFYFKTKKQTKQIHEQLKETQNRKTYSLNASSMMAKSECMAQSQVQLQNYSKPDRHPGPILHKVMESSFSGTQPFPEALSPDRGTQPIKHHRSLSSCCSPGQKSGMLHRNAFRRTPPLPRGRFNGITGPAYQQLEESRITDQDTIPCHGKEQAAFPLQWQHPMMQALGGATASSWAEEKGVERELHFETHAHKLIYSDKIVFLIKTQIYFFGGTVVLGKLIIGKWCSPEYI